MSEAIVAVPLDQGTLSATSAHASFPVANLHTDRPDLAWQSTSTAAQAIELDLGNTTTPVSLIALLFANLSSAATWRIRAASSQPNLTAAPSVDSGTLTFAAGANTDDAWRHGLLQLTPPVGTQPRWWRLDLADPAPVTSYFSAGRLVMDDAWQGGPAADGLDTAPDDLAVVTGLVTGGEVSGPSVLVPILDGLEILVSGAADYHARAMRVARRGRSRPVLAIRDPDASAFLQREMIYGRLLTKPGLAQVAPDLWKFKCAVRAWHP